MAKLSRIIKLTGPLLVSYISYHILGITDVLMVGQLGTQAIAGVGIALTVLWFLVVPVEGLLNSALIHLSRFWGSGEVRTMRRFLKIELLLGLGLGTVFLLLYWPLLGALTLYTQDSAVLKIAGDYLGWALLGVLPYSINWVLTRFVLSVQKTRFMGIVSWITVGINIFLNWVLIFGALGFPALGVAGAAIATLAARVIQIGIYAVYTRHLVKTLLSRPQETPVPGNKQVLKEIFHIGTPMAATSTLEVGGWVVFVNIVSRLGTGPMAAQEIGMKVKDLAFLPGLALGEITTNLVGESLGQGKPEEARRIVHQTLGLAMVVMTLFALLFVFGAEILVGFFTKDPGTVALGAGLLRIMALYQIFDAMFIVLRGALSALKDIKFVRNVMLVAWWVILLPLAWLFAGPLGWGVSGAWLAFLGFAGFAGVVFWFRFQKMLPKGPQGAGEILTVPPTPEELVETR